MVTNRLLVGIPKYYEILEFASHLASEQNMPKKRNLALGLQAKCPDCDSVHPILYEIKATLYH